MVSPIPHLAVLRFAKVKKIGDLALAKRHQFRTIPTPHADAATPDGVQVLMGDRDFDVRARELINTCTRRIRPDSVLAVEAVLTASPEFFSTDGDPTGPRDPEKTKAWQEAAVGWVREHIGAERVAGAVLHLDEATPHLHIFFVPLDTKTRKTGRGGKAETTETGLNAGRWLDGRERLSGHQTTYAEALAPLGIERGRVKTLTTATHAETADWRRNAAENEAQLVSTIKHRKALTEQAQAAHREAVAAQDAAMKERTRAQQMRQAAQADREAAAKEAAQAAALRQEAVRQREQAQALMVGVEAVADGRITGARQTDQGKALAYDTPESRATIGPQIIPAQPQVWAFADRIFKKTRERQEALLADAKRLVESTKLKAATFEKHFRTWWKDVPDAERRKTRHTPVAAANALQQARAQVPQRSSGNRQVDGLDGP